MIVSDDEVELLLEAIDNEVDSINTLNFDLTDDEVRYRDNLIALYAKIRDNTLVFVTPQRIDEMNETIKPEVDPMVSNPDFLEIV
jgi:hypothetical protein